MVYPKNNLRKNKRPTKEAVEYRVNIILPCHTTDTWLKILISYLSKEMRACVRKHVWFGRGKCSACKHANKCIYTSKLTRNFLHSIQNVTFSKLTRIMLEVTVMARSVRGLTVL